MCTLYNTNQILHQDEQRQDNLADRGADAPKAGHPAPAVAAAEECSNEGGTAGR